MRSMDLIHRIADQVVHSFKFPFVHYSIIHEDRMLDLIEELEATLPEELRQAQEVLAQRDKMLADARKEADEIVGQAKLHARNLVGETDIMRTAQAEVERMRQDVAAESQKSQVNADRYADDVLSELEVKVARALATVQNGRQQLNIS